MEEQKKVKCRITRADYPDDTSDIHAGLNGNIYTVQAGKMVELPVDIYRIFKDATRPVDIKEEADDGQIKVRVIDAPRFAILVDGVEDTSKTDERIAKLAKEKAAEVDALSKENKSLSKRISDLEADSAATQSIASENEELKKRIAELEAASKADDKSE